ncbi:MAG: ABC transporter permease [Chloroflexi bacterium]|nr:ABC transporter permease [Chloroflexota bacterium]
MFGELARLAIGNLRRARARLFMTAGGVLVGTTAVIILVSLTFGLQRSAEANIAQNSVLTEIEVYPSWSQDPEAKIPQLDVASIRSFWQIPGVAAVIPLLDLQGGGQLISDDYWGWGQVIGIDPSLLPYLGINLDQGELSLQSGSVLVGAKVGENFYDPESTSDEWTPITVDLMAQPFEIQIYQYSATTTATREIEVTSAGLIQAGTNYDYTILAPINDVIKWNEWSSGQTFDPKTFTFGRVIVRAKDRETTNPVSEAIRDLGFGTGGMGEYLNQLNRFFQTMRLMLGGVGGVALLVAAFGVANTMTMAILERTKEIGLMKAIGATDRDVLTIFLIEAGLVGLAGGGSGVGLSFFLRNIINRAVSKPPEPGSGGVTDFLPFDTSRIGGNLIIIPNELALGAVAMAVLVGICAGLYPAMRAARMQPVVALKSE